MTRPTLPWTRQGRFLRTLAKTGNVAEGCRAACLDRRLAYRWRDCDADFARRWKRAAFMATELLRDELMERALMGWEHIVLRHRPTAAHRQVRHEIFNAILDLAAAPLPNTLWKSEGRILRQVSRRSVRPFKGLGLLAEHRQRTDQPRSGEAFGGAQSQVPKSMLSPSVSQVPSGCRCTTAKESMPGSKIVAPSGAG